MASIFKRRKRRTAPPMEETLTPPPPLTPFQTLISAIKSPQGLNLPLLKTLYSVLLPMSLNESTHCYTNFEDGNFNHCGVKVKLEDVQCLIYVLFLELDTRFKLFLSALCSKHVESEADMLATPDLLPLLLRCCMLVLNLADPVMIAEKTQFLHSMLGKLISFVTKGRYEETAVSFQKFVSSQCTYTDAGGSSTTVSEELVASLSFIEPSYLWCPALHAVLEIFADEFVVSRLLKEYFILVDSTCTTEKLFQRHVVQANIGIVVEVISVHFILSVYGKRAYDNFLKRLFCEFGKHCRVPELSLTAAVSLLHNPIMLSAPKMMQTHLILLVSEAIDVDMSLKNARPDLRFMESYLTAFERSVLLYTNHMSSSLMDFHPLGVKCSDASSCMLGRSCQSSFESYVQQGTRDQVYELVTNSDSLWDLYLCNMLCKTKSELMAASTAYINESQHIFDESCKDDILSVLRSIIHGSFSCAVSDGVLYRIGDTNPQDIYLLASILKLMGTSLLKAICCLRHGGNLGSPKTLKDASSKEYDFVVGIIGCFNQFNVSLPNQKLLFDKMKTCPMIHKTSKWMLLHFSGLLSLSFASGIDFLVKGCISTIMALLNLYVFEEGDIVALSSSVVSGSQPFSSGLSPDKATEGVVKNKSIRRVALKFQKIQTLCLRKISLTSSHQRSQSEEVAEETCNGEVFLRCRLGITQKSDIDDLADFIACEPGKDYSGWWKDRERLIVSKYVKKRKLRWERRKNAWKSISMEGKKLGKSMKGKKSR